MKQFGWLISHNKMFNKISVSVQLLSYQPIQFQIYSDYFEFDD